MDGTVPWRARVAIVAVLAAMTVTGVALPIAWLATTVAGLGYSLSVVVADLRARRFATDVLATLSLVGTLVVGEHLAGALIALRPASTDSRW